MAFIKAQKLKRDDSGNIISGSASLMKSLYNSDAKRCSSHVTLEKLGKVLFLSSDHKIGIFQSPFRGLVEYNVNTGVFTPVDVSDNRIPSMVQPQPPVIHSIFGDSYFLIEFLQKTGLTAVLRGVFDKEADYERLLCHVFHGVLKDGSKIHCNDFIARSFVSYLISNIPIQSLRSDFYFFNLMGDDKVRLKFFKNFVKHMRSTNKNFGKGCYVDSTPLPNDIHNNPFNALSCHGTEGCQQMVRLILVLDRESGLPVWFDIIPGNVLDINTLSVTLEDVAASIDVIIDDLVMDAGYMRKSILQAFHIGTAKTIIGRMPNKKGFPFKTLYWQIRPELDRGKYRFVLNRHTYFGQRRKITLFGVEEYAYVYVDLNNALSLLTRYMEEKLDEFEALRDKDKDWYCVKFGYFVLLSNKERSPEELLAEYWARTQIETVFKTSKEYLDILPISKWTDLTVRGKILTDIVDTIIFLMLRKQLGASGVSPTEFFGKSSSLMCFKNGNEAVIEQPNRNVEQYYKDLQIAILPRVEIEEVKEQLLLK